MKRKSPNFGFILQANFGEFGYRSQEVVPILLLSGFTRLFSVVPNCFLDKQFPLPGRHFGTIAYTLLLAPYSSPAMNSFASIPYRSRTTSSRSLICSGLLRRGADEPTEDGMDFLRSVGAAMPIGIDRGLIDSGDVLATTDVFCVSVSGKTKVSCVNGTVVERLLKAVMCVPFFSAIERISKAI